MTVRVNKDAFNVREKLSELDYGHVPYEKAAPGSIIQVSVSKITTKVDFTSINYVTAYTHTFNPRFGNSILLHQFWAKSILNTSVGPNGQDFKINRNGVTGNLFESSWQNYLNRTAYASDFYPPCDFQFPDDALTTEPIVYSFNGRKYGAGATSANWSIGNTTFGTDNNDTTVNGCRGHWTIMEIKQ